jgi:hypothetical protein
MGASMAGKIPEKKTSNMFTPGPAAYDKHRPNEGPKWRIGSSPRLPQVREELLKVSPDKYNPSHRLVSQT